MSIMSKQNKVIAILTADWHLSHNPPVWRSAEPDWYEAMKRPLEEIENLSYKYDCPVFCAGDILNIWNSCAELINWLIKHIPQLHSFFAIAGQHDMPEHNIENMYRSAYETLALSKKIIDLDEGELEPLENFNLHVFPFGEKIQSVSNKKINKRLKNIAIVHDYVWSGKHKYPKAPTNKNINIQRADTNKFINNKLYGYDVIVYGDNHKGFLTKVGNTTIFNCGTLMRRKSDEIDYKPQVGLLYSDGTVEPHYLDISKDKHLTIEQGKDLIEQSTIDFRRFAKEMASLGDTELDFKEMWKQYCQINKVSKVIDNIVWDAMTGE